MSYTLAIGEKLKHFEIKSPLGSGGMGEVYLAYDESLSRHVAIKILKIPEGEVLEHVDAIKRFLAEAKVLAQLSSESITTIHYISKAEERIPFIVMEYLEGESLKEYSEKNRVNLRFLVNCLIQVANGLQLVHDRGIIHRDIKPANLFYTKSERFKILDFGIAKWTDSSVGVETKTNQFVGSLMYAPPEVFVSNDYDHRVDIYSLGISIISLLTGRPPFEGQTTYQVLNQIQNKDIRLSEMITKLIPEDFMSLLYEMIEKDPADRPKTMREVSERAAKILNTSEEVLDQSISLMLETGEIEINLMDTYDLRDLVNRKQKTATTKIGKKKKINKRPSPKKKAGDRNSSSRNIMAASIVLLVALASGISIYFSHKDPQSFAQKKRTATNEIKFQRVGHLRVLDETFRLINELPAGPQKARLQERFVRIEKLANEIAQNKGEDPAFAMLIRQFGRKLLRVEASLKANSYRAAEDELLVIQGILIRRTQEMAPKRLPSREGE